MSVVCSWRMFLCSDLKGWPELLSHAAHAFFAQVINATLGFLHRFTCLGCLSLALGYTCVPLGLLGQQTGFFIVFTLHGHFSLLPFFLSGTHLHRCIFGSACAHCAAYGRLGYSKLFGGRIAGAASQQNSTQCNGCQFGQLESFEGVGFHGLSPVLVYL